MSYEKDECVEALKKAKKEFSPVQLGNKNADLLFPVTLLVNEQEIEKMKKWERT